MLFMGEEWGSSQPFPYFCDFQGELGDLVRKGRREEFAAFPEFQDPAQRDRHPRPPRRTDLPGRQTRLEPSSSKTFTSEWLGWYKRILAIRREQIIPLAARIGGHAGTFRVIATGAVEVCFQLPDWNHQLHLAANLSDDSAKGFTEPVGRTIWQEGPTPDGTCMRPWSIRWSLRD